MRRIGFIGTLLAAAPLLMVSASTDVQAAPSEQRFAQAAQERVITTQEKVTVRHEATSQGVPAPPMREIIVQQAPPPPRQETIVEAPSPSHVWVPGYWTWNNDWQWTPGYFTTPPQRMTVWVPGQWLEQGPNWVWRPGHWK